MVYKKLFLKAQDNFKSKLYKKHLAQLIFPSDREWSHELDEINLQNLDFEMPSSREHLQQSPVGGQMKTSSARKNFSR